MFIKKLAVGAAVAALPLSLVALPAQAAPITNDITVEKSCTASDVTFEVRAEWKYTYVVNGVTKAAIDRLEWSIQDPGDSDPVTAGVQAYPQGVDPQYDQDSDTTDYVLKVYNGTTRVQTLRDEDADVYYTNDGPNGELWKGRNPKNPVVLPDSRIVFAVGVADDGKPKCKVSFRIPADLGSQLPE